MLPAGANTSELLKLAETDIEKLITIIQNGDLVKLEGFVQREPRLLIQPFKGEETIFIYAAKLGQLSIMSYLSEHSPQLLDLSCPQCRMALKKAIQGKKLDVIHFILEENFLFAKSEEQEGKFHELTELLYELAALAEEYANNNIQTVLQVQTQSSPIQSFLNFLIVSAVIKTQRSLIESLKEQNDDLRVSLSQQTLKVAHLQEQLQQGNRVQESTTTHSNVSSLILSDQNSTFTSQFETHKRSYSKISAEEEPAFSSDLPATTKKLRRY